MGELYRTSGEGSLGGMRKGSLGNLSEYSLRRASLLHASSDRNRLFLIATWQTDMVCSVKYRPCLAISFIVFLPPLEAFCSNRAHQGGIACFRPNLGIEQDASCQNCSRTYDILVRLGYDYVVGSQIGELGPDYLSRRCVHEQPCTSMPRF